MLIALNVFSVFKFNYDCTEEISYRSKINSRGVYVVKKETREGGFIQVLK